MANKLNCNDAEDKVPCRTSRQFIAHLTCMCFQTRRRTWREPIQIQNMQTSHRTAPNLGIKPVTFLNVRRRCSPAHKSTLSVVPLSLLALLPTLQKRCAHMQVGVVPTLAPKLKNTGRCFSERATAAPFTMPFKPFPLTNAAGLFVQHRSRWCCSANGVCKMSNVLL